MFNSQLPNVFASPPMGHPSALHCPSRRWFGTSLPGAVLWVLTGVSVLDAAAKSLEDRAGDYSRKWPAQCQVEYGTISMSVSGAN